MRRWVLLVLVFLLIAGHWPGSTTESIIPHTLAATQPSSSNDVGIAQHPDPASICFDLTGNGRLGITEVQTVASFWRVRAGDPQWPTARQYDFAESGDINVTDIMLAVAAMGNECPFDLPPDPVYVAPPVSSSVTTTLYDATAFLYTGPNPIQRDVAADTIEPQRAAVIRGQVRDRDGAPLPGVTITVLNHPEFGYTYSRANSLFDLVVNGGGVLTLDYQKDDYLPAQRQVQAPWQDYVWAPDVVMIPLDEKVTPIDLTETEEIQVARGSLMNDDDGARQATLMFLPATTAQMVMPDGSTQALTHLSVRATEYTVGESGPEAMPAELPPTPATPMRWSSV